MPPFDSVPLPSRKRIIPMKACRCRNHGSIGLVRIISTLFMLPLFMLWPADSQIPGFEHFAVREGVSQSEIICIFQDSEGFIWFGTQNGLNKFDGYRFVNYLNDPYDTTSLSNNWIFDITEDRSGNLWVATKNGLNRFDKKNGVFSLVNHKGTGSVVTDDFVYGLESDGIRIFVNIPPELSVIHTQTGELKSFRHGPGYSGILYDKGVPVLIASDGRIWTGTHDGLYIFDPLTEKFSPLTYDPADPSPISHNHVTALSETRKGYILAGTENGLNIIHPLSGRIVRFNDGQLTPQELNGILVRAVLEDHEGHYWIGTEGSGLIRIKRPNSGGGLEIDHFRSGTGFQNMISHDIVFSLLEDRSHNLWVGTIAGIDKTDLKKKYIRFIRKSEDAGSVDIPDNVIASIYKERTGNLWVGTWGKGLTLLDAERKPIATYHSSYHDWRHIPEDHAHVLYKDRASRLWLGTRNGVAVFNPKERSFTDVATRFNTKSFDVFNNIRVYSILEHSSGTLWFGTSNGVIILDLVAKTARLMKSDDDTPLHLSSNLVYSIMEDREGDVWIATLNGLDRLFPNENKIIHYRYRHGVSNGLCDNFTISLHQDTVGNIWIGTSSGLNCFNKKDSVFSYYSVKNGLPGNIIYDIVEDANHNLWFSTGRGLAWADPLNDDRQFRTVDELAGEEFNIKAVFKGYDGEMFFGGMNGLVSFYPDSLRDNLFIPPVRITSFEKETNGIRQEVSVYDPVIRLTHKDYAFTIGFSALEFTNPSRNRYAWKMEGISGNWIDNGNRHSVPFTKLPPGDYIFRVKGSNNDGVWNETPTSLKIHIDPPWWRSRLAYGAYIFLILSGIILVVYIREKNLIREKKLLEIKVRERTAEIEKQKEKAVESEEKLKSTINSLDDLVFVLDRNGVFREFYNPRSRDINFRNPELYIDKYYKDAGIPGGVDEKLDEAFESLGKDEGVFEFDYSFGTGEKKQWYNAKVSPKRNADGELTGIVIVAREITDRKKAEELLARQKEELKELNMMKDKFLSILAHDLKNPFTNLYSMSDLVIRNYQDLTEEEKVMALKNIHKAAQFIYTLLENLLTWANTQRGRIPFNPVDFDLSGLIEVNVNLHQIPARNKSISLSSSAHPGMMAYGDREMIDTVIRNLVSNAVKFTSPGGNITIDARRQSSLVEVKVTDTGTGIASRDMPKLFHLDEKYKSTGTAGEPGTGLGLALCKEFVEKNGGTIRCDSTPGKGSAFSFTVPAGKMNNPAELNREEKV